jgi:hypothetical protein
MDTPDLAIIYWFYKEPKVTKNHLELMRSHNRERKIFGLFGGDPKEADSYHRLLGDLLDDFWVYPGTYGTKKYDKWMHGDLMLLDWYDKRGRGLSWWGVAIIQWDVLLFDDVANLTPGIQAGQVYFSGFRNLDQEIESRWSWTRPGSIYRDDYITFRAYVTRAFGYEGHLKCCLYIYEILSRPLFEGYLRLEDKKLGMLEYKAPTLAHVLGLDIYDYDLGVYWDLAGQAVHSLPLNAMPVQIRRRHVRQQLALPQGWRLFHPFEKAWRH